MKTLLKFLFLFLLSGSLNAQCVVVGQNVGINNLTQALSSGTLSITNGELNEKDICIDGTFTFDNKIVDITDVEFSNNILIFDNSIISGSNVNIENGWVLIRGSILDLDDLECTNNARFELSNSSFGRFNNSLFQASDMDRRIQVLENSKLLCTTTIFNDTGIDIDGNGLFIPVDSDFIGKLRPAIHLIKGNAVGKENFFKENTLGVFLDSEDGNFTGYKDENSTYEDMLINQYAGSGGFAGVGIVDFFGGNLFIEKSKFKNCEESGIITRSPSHGSKIHENKFENSARGVYIANDNEAVVTDNRFINMAVTGVYNQLSSDNIIRNNTVSSFNANTPQNWGIFSASTINSKYELNNISGNGRAGIRSEHDENASFHTNVIDSGYVAGVHSLNSLLSQYCNNSLFYNESGGRFGLDNLQLDVKDNHFWLNDIGLLYEEDVVAPQQVEKGNDFFGNSTIGASINGIPLPAAVQMMQFITDGSQYDFPSHEPNDFFTDTGNESPNCSSVVTPTGGMGMYPQEVDKDLLKFMIDCKKVNGAECDYRKIKVFNQIENYPSFMTNADLATFYNQYVNTGTDEVPLVTEIVRELSSIIFEAAPLPVVIDNQNNISLGTDLDNVINSNAIGYMNYYNAKVNLVNSIKSQIAGIIPDNNYQQLYLEILDIYLDLTLTSPIQSQKDELKTAAELCYDTDGMGVLLARQLCESFQIDFISPQNCNDPRNRNAEQDEFDDLSVYPNPGNGIFNLKEGSIQSYDVYNTNGLLIKSGTSDGNPIDISDYPNGMYILKPKNGSKAIKLIKLD